MTEQRALDYDAIAKQVVDTIIEYCLEKDDVIKCLKKYTTENLRDALETVCGLKRSISVYKVGPVLSVLLQYCGKIRPFEWPKFWQVFAEHHKLIAMTIRCLPTEKTMKKRNRPNMATKMGCDEVLAYVKSLKRRKRKH